MTQIFHFTKLSQPLFTCSKSVIKTESHCSKIVQGWKKKASVKYVALSFYKCSHFLLFWLLSDLWIYHFHCYSMLFLSLYLSFHLDSLHPNPDFPRFSHFHPHSPHSFFDSRTRISVPHFPHSVPQFPIWAFTDSLCSVWQSAQNLF